MRTDVLPQIPVLYTNFSSREGVNAILRNFLWAYNKIVLNALSDENK